MRCRILRRIFPRVAALIALVSAGSLAVADPHEPDSPTLSPELQAALQELLSFDSSRAAQPLRGTPLRVPSPTSSELNWNRTDKSDGSAAVTVKKPLPLEWDTSVGADIGLPPAPALTYQPDRPIQSAKDPGSGAAWANVTVVPGLASVDARIDPTKEQGRIGTTLSRSLPLGSGYSITLQNSYALTDTLWGAPTPAGGGAAPGIPTQVWTNDRMVKFKILSTGTSLAAGTTNSSIDNITRNKFSAEQKLFENFNVTTSVTDVGAPSANKSITAGFKLKW